MRISPLQQPPQLAGVVCRVVPIPQHDVLISHPPTGDVEVVVRRVQHPLQSDLPVHRDQLISQRFVRGVQRDRQVVRLVEPGQVGHFLGQPDRRNSHPPGRHPQPSLFFEGRQGRQQVLEIGEWFTHPHHHHVGDPLGRRKQPVEPQHLLENLPRGEVAGQPQQSTGAEDAAHATPHLGAQADGPPVLLAHQHALDVLAIVQAQQQLFGPIDRFLMPHDLARKQRQLALQVVAQPGREVGHQVVTVDPFAKDPPPDLVGAETGNPVGLAPHFQFLAGQVQQAGPRPWRGWLARLTLRRVRRHCPRPAG